MGQLSEAEGAQHESLGATCVQSESARCVIVNTYCLWSPYQEFKQQNAIQQFIHPPIFYLLLIPVGVVEGLEAISASLGEGVVTLDKLPGVAGGNQCKHRENI